MKKIINGKKYNTETARVVGAVGHEYPSDLRYWREELYRKKTGEFFLYGKGGPMSKYARRTAQNEWSGGEEIIPLTEKEAREWVETYLSAEEYEQIFGEVEE